MNHSDIDFQLAKLRELLAQQEEILSVISDNHNHEEIRGHVEQLRTEIKKIETWKEQQQRIRVQGAIQNTFDNGAPSGGA